VVMPLVGLPAVWVFPNLAIQPSWILPLAGFAVFRLFDIWKPFPCRQLDEGHGGLGIMADDWGAAAWMAFGLAVGRQAGWW